MRLSESTHHHPLSFVEKAAESSQMGLVALDALFLSYLPVELLELLLGYPGLNWRIQRLCTRCLSFLLAQARFLAVMLRIQGDLGSSTVKESPAKSQVEEHLRLSVRDVEIVMERIGGLCSCKDGWIKEAIGADELNTIFEEEEPSLKEVKKAFCIFDQNGDGFIGAEELQRVLSNLGFTEGPTLDKCRQMIGAYDKNQDGKVDFREFLTLMERSFY